MEINKQFFGVIFCIAMTSVMEVYTAQFESEMCFMQALEIHADLKNKLCPDRLLLPGKNCSILCKGRYNIYDISKEKEYCVKYTMEGILSTTLEFRLCKISNCIIEDILFECSLPDSGQINRQNQTTEKERRDNCFGLGIVIPLTLSCVIAGSLTVICILCLIKHLRNWKKRFSTEMQTSVFYQSRSNEEHGFSEGRIIINPLEDTEYTDIKDDFRMVSKAIQVPSYQEDSSSSSNSRSRETFTII